MPSFGVAIAWIIISPFAFLTNCLGVAFILHYRPLYHSCDVAFLSIFITMATNAMLLLPIPAVVKLGDYYWSQNLCAAYIWLSITLRSAHILVLLSINVYWMASLRLSTKKQLFTSATPMKLSVCICWFLAIIIGIIPASDTTHNFDYYTDNTCMFLPMSIKQGYGIFFMIISLLSTVMGVISSLDTCLIFKSMKDVAKSKYSADRYHLPTISGSLRPGTLIHAKYNELNVSLELCRLVLVFSIVSSVINSIPLTASQFVQLIQDYNRETMETTLLWLLLLESFIVPHLLWVMSRRYRHAVVYTWKVFVLRDKSYLEEDTSDCTLQNFRLNVKEVTHRPHTNGMLSIQANGHTQVTEDVHMDVMSDANYMASTSRGNGYPHNGHAGKRGHEVESSNDAVTDIEDGLTVVTRVTSPDVVVIHEGSQNTTRQHRRNIYSHSSTPSDTSFTLDPPNGPNDNPGHPHSSGFTSPRLKGDNNVYTSQILISPIKSTSITSNFKVDDGKRSTSTTSRQEWKDQMRKKHLPAVFLDNSVKSEQNSLCSREQIHSAELDRQNEWKRDNHVYETVNEMKNQSAVNQTTEDNKTYRRQNSGDYDYDYDYVNDTLIRARPQTFVKLKKVNRSYNDTDIGLVLDELNTGDNSLTTDKINQDSSTHNLSPLLESRQINLYQNTSRNEKINPYNIETMNSTSLMSRPADNNTKKTYNGTTFSNVDNKRLGVHEIQPANRPENPLYVQTNPDRTGSRVTPIQSDPADVAVSSGYPIILRTHYRKFLPYMDLVISNVDNVSENDRNGFVKSKDLEQDLNSKPLENNAVYVDKATLNKNPDLNMLTSTEKRTELDSPKFKTTAVRNESASNTSSTTSLLEDQASNISHTTSELKQQASNKHNINHVFQNEPQAYGFNRQLGIPAADLDLPSGDYPQDYSQLETLSGSEMLRLKMKSVRSAVPIYHRDGTTSDEDGIDNTAFDGISDEDSEDSSRVDKSPVVSGNLNSQTLPDLKRRSTGSGRSTSPTSTLGHTIESPEYTPEQNYNGDGEESDLNSLPSNTYQTGVVNYSFKDEPENNSLAHDVDVDSHTTNQIHKIKTLTKGHIPIFTQISHKVDKLSSKINSPPNLTNLVPNYLPDSNHTSSSDIYSPSTYQGNHKTQPDLEKTLQDSVDSQRINDGLSHNVSPVRAGLPTTPMAKPPRQRKNSLDSSLERLPNLENESKSTTEYKQPQTTQNSFDKLPKYEPESQSHGESKQPKNTYNSLTNSLKFVATPSADEDIGHISELSSLSDNESNISGDSVTIEPYGPRRPAWMSDLLLISPQSSYNSSQNFPKNNQIPGNTSANEISTNFVSKFDQNSPNNLIEYKSNADEKNHTPNLGMDKTSTVPYRYKNLVVQYDFDEESDQGFENHLTIDYTDPSNYYRNRNIIFESIKEEPEDCLSDSASVLENSDSHSTTFLRSPQPQHAKTLASPTDIPHSQTTGKVDVNSQQSLDIGGQNNQRVFGGRNILPSTVERTSADGSEAVPQTFNGNGNSAKHNLSPAHKLTTTTIKNQPTLVETDNGNHTTNSKRPIPFYAPTNTHISHSLGTNIHNGVQTVNSNFNSDIHRPNREQNAHSSGNFQSNLENTNYKSNDIPRELALTQPSDTTNGGVKVHTNTIAYF